MSEDPIKARRAAIDRMLSVAKSKGANREAEIVAIKSELDKSRHKMKARLEATRDDIRKAAFASGNKKVLQLVSDIMIQVSVFDAPLQATEHYDTRLGTCMSFTQRCPPSYDPSWDAAMVGRALAALQMSQLKLEDLATDCANYENVKDLLHTVRETVNLTNFSTDLQKHMGEREMNELERKCGEQHRSLQSAVAVDDMDRASTTLLGIAACVNEFRSFAERESASLVTQSLKLAATKLQARASNDVTERVINPLKKTMSGCGKLRWAQCMSEIEKQISVVHESIAIDNFADAVVLKLEEVCGTLDKFSSWCEEMETRMVSTGAAEECIKSASEVGAEALAAVRITAVQDRLKVNWEPPLLRAMDKCGEARWSKAVDAIVLYNVASATSAASNDNDATMQAFERADDEVEAFAVWCRRELLVLNSAAERNAGIGSKHELCVTCVSRGAKALEQRMGNASRGGLRSEASSRA
eukprot:CAMPEP_0197611904 /NCGR_PEP_ID=MMETSP1326-20131121/56262_1 /TAXON_ID=1155430 /ORGANISM="Genus nov. species nov., Strain RCC2288" /LENGTH=470 /DNA_ID=CAMNT_0043180607 /DNA_START=43 /DNA_END=1455 /DNA_ORIENTATION=-